jgi:phosphatidate cytidylyltransferase
MENELIKRLISGIVLLSFVIYGIGYSPHIFPIIVVLCWIGLLYEWWRMNKTKLSYLFLGGVLYISIPMAFLILPCVIDVVYDWPPVFYPVLCITVTYDVMAYFSGKLFGGAKLAPNISPNKTWSGTIIGAMFAYIVGVMVHLSFWNFTGVMVYVIFLVVAAIWGDLLESKVKRHLGVKDSGVIIPGHGGICDRLDSFLLALYCPICLTILYYAFQIFH